jgi:hypothetical protein
LHLDPQPPTAAGWNAPLPFAVAAFEPLFDPDAPVAAGAPARPVAGPLARLRRAATDRCASLDALDLARGALAAWAAIAAACLALWSLRWRRLARQVAGRRPLDGEPRRILEELCARAGRRRAVRSSVTPALAAPISFGILRAEVCVPERALTELAPDELRAMLAHELAHVVRRDPLWLALAGVLERVLFFQPFSRFARRRWQVEAELACDDLAVRWTDERLSLATCLTEVAGWLLHEPRALTGLPVPSMALAAHGRAGLGRRVRRLIDEPPSVGRHGSRWMAPLCVAGLASIVAAAPRIAPTARAAEAPEHALRGLALVVLERAAVHVDRLPAQQAFAGDDTAAARHAVMPDPVAPLDEVVPAPEQAPQAVAAEPVADAQAARDVDALEPVEAPEPVDDRPATPLALAPDAQMPEALQVIGPHGLARVAVAEPEPGFDAVLLGLERSIALLEAELRAIADEAEARPQALDGWTERVARLERRIRRLGEQHERLAATAALLTELDPDRVGNTTTTTDFPFGTSPMTFDEVNR